MSRRVVAGVLAALVGGLLAVSAMPVQAASFTPVADTYVDASAPTTNYGTKAYVKADNEPVLRSYLRFNVQGLGGASSGVLKLYAESGSNAGVEVHAVSSTTWGETTTNSSNAPAVGALLGHTGPFTAGTWLSVDVSSAITGDGLVSFAVTTPAGTA
jgi:hypothetical protein